MAFGTVTNIGKIFSKSAHDNPYIILVVLLVLLFAIIFLERIYVSIKTSVTGSIDGAKKDGVKGFITGLESGIYGASGGVDTVTQGATETITTIVSSTLIMIIFVLIIGITVAHIAFPESDYIAAWNNVFSSTSSKNFLSVLVFMFFMIYMYEVSEYGNNDPQDALDKVMRGRNIFVSNRFAGMGAIIFIAIVTGYSIYVTTIEAGKK